MALVHETEELVKAAPHGMKRCVPAEVPLAEQGRRVAGVMQMLR